MDKTVGKGKWICMLLVLLLLLSAMCHVHRLVDSIPKNMDAGRLTSDYFSQLTFSQNEHETSEELAGLSDVGETLEIQSRAQGKSSVEMGWLLLLLAFQPEIPIHFAEMLRQQTLSCTYNQGEMIRYIHRKDGLKD